MKIKVISIEGKKISDMEISDKVFLLKPNKEVIRTLVDWQISISKPRTAKTKQRNEIRGSTAKIYAQKGTGGARHSSRKAPLFIGGGIAHGPKGAVYRIKKINKKVKKLGLMQALSQKIKVKQLFVLDDIKEEIKKTKMFNEFLKKNNLKNSLFISDKNSKLKIIKSAKNIPNIKVIDENGTNAVDVLKYKNVVFTTSSIKSFQDRIIKWKKFII